jgi:5'-deoxynucleotidase YfbR-like HD superfamily hydrolase
MEKNIQGLADIGNLIFKFAKVNRVTLHEDGKRRESDTDHTVMLSVGACALAEALYKDTLDLGKIAQFSIVHDLVEAYAGDTDTFGIDPEKYEEKAKREYEAYLTIERQFKNVFPWIPETIQAYETLETKEARFVKTVDKCMSKVTHLLNDGQYFKDRNIEEGDMVTGYRKMIDKVAGTYGSEFPEVIDIMEGLLQEARKKTYSTS